MYYSKSKNPISLIYNMDCLEYMRSLPDKHFDLCIADPPYGININESIGRRAGAPHSGRKKLYGIVNLQARKSLKSCSEQAKIL